MRRYFAVRALSSLGLIALVVFPLLAFQTSQPARRQSIYVVAVKDSSLFTMCPDMREVKLASGRTWKSDGNVVVRQFADDLQALRFLPPGRGDLSADDPRFLSDLGLSAPVRTPASSRPVSGLSLIHISEPTRPY